MLRYFPLEGRLILSDDTTEPPHVIFDTDDAMLCVKPDHFFEGSEVVPARTASSSGVNGLQTVVDVETDYYIATIDIPGTKVVRGMIRTTWASNPEPADNLWRQASGTHLDLLDGVNLTAVPQDDLAGYTRVATLGAYTFYVDDLNHLMLKERLVVRCRDSGNPPTNFNRARQECTVSFRLLVGFFLQSDFTARPGIALRGARSSGRNLFDGSLVSALISSPNVSLGVGVGPDFTGRRLLHVVCGIRGGSNNGSQPNLFPVSGGWSSGGTTLGSVTGSSGNQCSICLRESVQSGTGALSVTANWPNTQNLCLCLRTSARNYTNATPTIETATVNGGAAASVTLDMAPNRYALVCSVCRAASGDHPVCTWDNAVALSPSITGTTEFFGCRVRRRRAGRQRAGDGHRQLVALRQPRHPRRSLRITQ
jgi:hypothetical protein